MISTIIEATNVDKFNFGKFLVSVYDEEERTRKSIINEGHLLITSIGKGLDDIQVKDLQTGEGLTFPGHFRKLKDPARRAFEVNYYMNKHMIWVCPMYQAFVEWLFEQDLSDIKALPQMVDTLPNDACALYGYRRGDKTEAEIRTMAEAVIRSSKDDDPATGLVPADVVLAHVVITMFDALVRAETGRTSFEAEFFDGWEAACKSIRAAITEGVTRR